MSVPSQDGSWKNHWGQQGPPSVSAHKLCTSISNSLVWRENLHFSALLTIYSNLSKCFTAIYTHVLIYINFDLFSSFCSHENMLYESFVFQGQACTSWLLEMTMETPLFLASRLTCLKLETLGLATSTSLGSSITRWYVIDIIDFIGPLHSYHVYLESG